MLSRNRLVFVQWSLFGLLTAGIAFHVVSLVRDGMLNPNFGHIHTTYRLLLELYPLALYGLALVFGALTLLIQPRSARRYGFAIFGLLLGSLLLGLRHYVTYVEPERLVVQRIEFVTDKVTAPLRILHISDTHFPAWGPYEQSVIQTMEEWRPDLIIHSGDFVQVVAPMTFNVVWESFLSELRAISQPRYGIFAVFGDTDWDIHRIRPGERLPIQFLSSANQVIETHAGKIDIMGLNLSQSRYPEWGLRAIDRWLSRSPQGVFRIAIGHAPDFAMALKEKPIDLLLAGHTHGGQVRLPFIGPLVIDSNVSKEWASGLRSIGVPYLNVSAGAGSNRFEGLPPIRFGCPTEITIIDLIPPQSPAQ